ncbi:hypothetical protein [Haliangium sp.]|uniref:hypothetical protein n=1 Tax=Haliangium sp. TaxID=2663208 RepID=UPI003D0BA104
MAFIELGPLSTHLEDEEVGAITKALDDAELAVEFDDEADSRLVEGDIDEAIFADFIDRLDAQGAACDLYVPGDFEEVIEVGGYSVGSSHALMMALDELRDDLLEEEEEEDDDEEYEEFDDDEDDNRFMGSGSSESANNIRASELRHLWKVLYKSARSCARDHVCLFVNFR